MHHPDVIAFHLPQFHPVPENDEWWGAGFTEWTNTTRAKPLFRGHNQPHLPADLGFYDLRLPQAREAQAALAQTYGVTAFCYWHYWFDGRRLLETPVNEILRLGKPDMPYCLGWANQTWTGVWHGAPGKVLMEQTYPGATDDEAHFEALLPFFRDDRYYKVDNRPLFYVFRPEQLPDASAWIEKWQQMARNAGLPGLYLVAEVSDLLGRGPVYLDVDGDGFDAGVYVRIPVSDSVAAHQMMRLRRRLRGGPEVYPVSDSLPLPPSEVRAERLHPCVYANWDNTPRSRKRGVVMTGSSPEKFEQHVGEAVRRTNADPAGERLIFVKSWNEWAEGNYLEPDLEHGHGWLTALLAGLGS